MANHDSASRYIGINRIDALTLRLHLRICCGVV